MLRLAMCLSPGSKRRGSVSHGRRLRQTSVADELRLLLADADLRALIATRGHRFGHAFATQVATKSRLEEPAIY
jgi:hypothetical protein